MKNSCSRYCSLPFVQEISSPIRKLPQSKPWTLFFFSKRDHHHAYASTKQAISHVDVAQNVQISPVKLQVVFTPSLFPTNPATQLWQLGSSAGGTWFQDFHTWQEQQPLLVHYAFMSNIMADTQSVANDRSITWSRYLPHPSRLVAIYDRLSSRKVVFMPWAPRCVVIYDSWSAKGMFLPLLPRHVVIYEQ